MIKLDWLFAKQGYSDNGNDFLEILDKLDDTSNETLNATTLIDALLIPVIQLKERVILYVYLPFLLQTFLCILYFSVKLEEIEPENTIWSNI